MQLCVISGRHILIINGKQYDITSYIEEEIERRKLFDDSLKEHFDEKLTKKQAAQLADLRLRYNTMRLFIEDLIEKSSNVSDKWFKDGNVHGHMISLRQELELIKKWLEQLDV